MNFSSADISRYRQRLTEIRESGRHLFQGGAPGIQTATFLCQSLEGLILDIWSDILRGTSPKWSINC
jgi:hypothetical protein